MKNYYDILGVKNGASEAEIKRQYFKLVRQFPPEENPEKFKEIREAYEYLKEEKNRTDDAETVPADPWACRMLEQIKAHINHKVYWMGANTAIEAMRMFPKENIFLFYLSFCERKSGYTGRAVKSCELLVKKEPDNIRYAREMALAYAARGYRKKALAAFEAAFARGCRDLEFVVEYALCCEESKLWQRGRDLLMDTVSQDCKWTREDIPKLLDSYAGLIQFNSQCAGDNRGEQIIHGFIEFISRYACYIEDCYDAVVQIFMEISKECVGLGVDALLQLKGTCDILEDAYVSDEAKESLKELRIGMEGVIVCCDDRFSDAVKYCWEFYNDCIPWEEWESGNLNYIKKYARLDCQLLLLAGMPGILKEFELLKEVAPESYDNFSDDIQMIASASNLSYLKSKLLKEYRRMSEYTGGGHYFEVYPEDNVLEAAKWNEEKPYVRQGKKIGRNDPCPCGSGKKYKQCCGRNCG